MNVTINRLDFFLIKKMLNHVVLTSTITSFKKFKAICFFKLFLFKTEKILLEKQSIFVIRNFFNEFLMTHVQKISNTISFILFAFGA
jgi:hypothetical protein